ncbi:hypothetical protein GBAR_LOCUS386, partial [Geodia barretti]
RAEVSSNRKDATSRRKRSSAILTPRKIQLTRNTSVYASQTQLLVTQCENQTLKTQENADVLSLKEAEIAAITKEIEGKTNFYNPR